MVLFTVAICAWAVVMHIRQQQSALPARMIPPPLRTRDGRTILRWRQEQAHSADNTTPLPAQDATSGPKRLAHLWGDAVVAKHDCLCAQLMLLDQLDGLRLRQLGFAWLRRQLEHLGDA